MSSEVDVSVVICCYNSEERIIETLRHLASTADISLVREVLIVDNSSEDRTAEVALDVWDSSLPPLKVVCEARSGLSFARACGVRAASGSIIVFLDDDNWVRSGFFQKLIEEFNRFPEAGIVGCKVEAVLDGDEPSWFREYQGSFAIGPVHATAGEVPTVYGAGMAIRRQLSLRIFDSTCLLMEDRKGNKTSSGGDSELCYLARLMGWRVRYLPEAQIQHFLPAGRLTDSYLLRLLSGLGASTPVLALYGYGLHCRSVWCLIIKYYVLYVRFYTQLILMRRIFRNPDHFRLHRIAAAVDAFQSRSFKQVTSEALQICYLKKTSRVAATDLHQ